MTIYQKLNDKEIDGKLKFPRGAKTIRIPVDEKIYTKMVNNSSFFRERLKVLMEKYPELFPSAMTEGFTSRGFTEESKKLGIKFKRITLKSNKKVYTIMPPYVMSYMTAYTKDVDKVLFLQRFNVPYWALAFVFGKNVMYWYRMAQGFGRNSIVGTTVRTSDKLPEHLLADEKHSKLRKDKIYVATTVGANCILGASISKTADEQGLTQAYQNFQKETKNVSLNYDPKTVNTDGWKATGLAWKKSFAKITIIVCFLHAFLKIRERCKKKDKGQLKIIGEKVWDAYKAISKSSFSQKLRRLKEWTEKNTTDEVVKDKTLALCKKSKRFAIAYDFPKCHRTSNGVDRLMRWLDQYLFNSQYFHGTLASAEKGVRAWAILRNFQPYYTNKKDEAQLICAAQKLNGFVYKDKWLENLIISTSMAGYRQ